MQMNTHPATEEDLMAYLDGELSPGAASEMAAHLERCKECQAVAADLQSVSRSLCGWSLESPNLQMSRKIRAELDSTVETQEHAKRNVFGWFAAHRAGIVFSAGGMLVLAGLLFTASRSVQTSRIRTSSIVTGTRNSELEKPSAEALDGVQADAIRSSPDLEKFKPGEPARASEPPHAPALLIVRTAELSLMARNFGNIRHDIESVLGRYEGHIAQLDINTPNSQARSLNATLRIPAARLDAALGELRKLGHVDGESQRGEEVTQRSVDIEARLANARNTEQRLTEILRTRTGKLSDVLEVEEQLDRVRGQIETAEAEQKSLSNQVELATVQLKVSEEFKQPLAVERPGTLTRIRNSAVEGIRTAADGTIGFLTWLLSTGPSLLLIGALLFFPVRWLWKQRTHG